MSVEGNHLDDKAYFSCTEGYYLLGIQTIQCLVTGQWSNTTPKCMCKLLKWLLNQFGIQFYAC